MTSEVLSAGARSVTSTGVPLLPYRSQSILLLSFYGAVLSPVFPFVAIPDCPRHGDLAYLCYNRADRLTSTYRSRKKYSSCARCPTY